MLGIIKYKNQKKKGKSGEKNLGCTDLSAKFFGNNSRLKAKWLPKVCKLAYIALQRWKYCKRIVTNQHLLLENCEKIKIL